MPVDPAAQAVLDLLAQMGGPPLESLSPAEARQLYSAMAAARGHEGAEVASVADRDVAGVPCRVITPVGVGSPAPVLVWFHGGGWTIGSAADATPVCRDLAVGAGCVVVDVDYRLAPEHPFPAAHDDAVAVTRWVLDHADELGGNPTRVAVGGDSAGGNLAAVAANDVPGVCFQALVYPATDLTLSHPSIVENGEGFLLTRGSMEWFTANYASGADPEDPRLSPLFADLEVLARTPPAHVITAGYDPLRDEGRAYVDRLREAGVAVAHDLYEDQIHAFFTMYPTIPAAADAVAGVATNLREALAHG